MGASLVCDSIFRILLERSTLIGDIVIVVPFHSQRVTAIAECHSGLGIDVQKSFETSDRLIVLLTRDVSSTAIVERVGMVCFFQQREIGAVDGFQIFTLFIVRN